MESTEVFGRLLLDEQLVKQTIGYHQFARMLVAFSPHGEGEHCSVETDHCFTPELRDAALRAFSAARQERGLKGMLVICWVQAHEVDSHPLDFRTCANQLISRHLREPALGPVPTATSATELLQYWQSERERVGEAVSREVSRLLSTLAYAQPEMNVWERGTESHRVVVRFYPGRPAATLDLSVERQFKADKAVEISSLSRLVGRREGFALESSRLVEDIISALTDVLELDYS